MRYYLYAESMMDEDGIPIAESMKICEAENVRQAAQTCIAETPGWLRPKLEECIENEDWATISISIGDKENLLVICELDFEKVKNL